MTQDSPTNNPANTTKDAVASDWTENQLPPVKPPTAGLLMQLFFVPMIIVTIIVGVWLAFGWLAQSGRNPEQLAASLEQLNNGSWQDAHSLSTLLQHPRQKELRKNSELAGKLSETLTGLLEEENLVLSPHRHQLATYLCQALGKFEVDTGIESLMKAVQYDDFEIRRNAVEGICQLAGKMSDLGANHPNLVPSLQTPAMDRPEVPDREKEIQYGEARCASAFALGLIGGDDAIQTLVFMLGDPYPEARYNAATGLARSGDNRAIPRLVEMLKIDNEEALKYEAASETMRDFKRNVVILNGLRGTLELYKHQPDAKVDPDLVDAITQVKAAGIFTDRSVFVLDEALRMIDDRK